MHTAEQIVQMNGGGHYSDGPQHLEETVRPEDAEGITVRQCVAFMLKVARSHRAKGHDNPAQALEGEAYGLCKAFDHRFITETGEPGEHKL